ncbi:MAG: 3-hydroxyacyl-CoA dehydrogenase family protein [Bacteroidetes bacterium]|nr:3-hydroxyacyl-CoA dehydrogenase family protein [Bacteroidota bacterium]
MNYEERLQNVSVLGAAGKMGSGILLLTALEMADLSLKPDNKGKKFVINAIDVSDEALSGLMKYLRAQALKAAEKKIVALRQVYKDNPALIENSEIIDQYVLDVLSVIKPSTRMESALDSMLIFEAIKEDPALKVKIFSYIRENNPNTPWFFTNTSSIPIGELDEKAKLEGRIIGFHFYNPPAIQKLVEVINAKNTLPEVNEFALAYAKNLRKVVVPSNDVAGFIGNGHFMRDILHASGEVEKLRSNFSLPEAIYAMNKISHEYLIRPMGIFQLIDYVGVDVCSYILSVMQSYKKDEKLHCPLLDQMLALGIKGGQFADGSQKDGILKYEKGKVTGVFDPGKKEYVMVSALLGKVDGALGQMPVPQPWKNVVGNPGKEEILKSWFSEIKNTDSFGANMTKAYGLRSREIGVQLVTDKVAFNEKDVNTVLLTGFFHAYGPVNDYLM